MTCNLIIVFNFKHSIQHSFNHFSREIKTNPNSRVWFLSLTLFSPYLTSLLNHLRHKIDIRVIHVIKKVDDDVIKCKHFSHNWPFVRGIHWSLVNSPPPTKASDAELWCFLWTNGWANHGDAGDLRCHRAHYDVNCSIWRLYSISDILIIFICFV